MPAPLTMEQKIAKAEEKAAARNTAERPQRNRRASFNGTEGKLRIGHQIEGYHLTYF